MLNQVIIENYSDFKSLNNLFKNWEFSVNNFLKYIFDKNRANDLIKHNLLNTDANFSMSYFTNEKGNIIAFLNIEYMSWESEMLGYKVGKINLVHSELITDNEINSIVSGAILNTKNNGFDMIYAKINTKNIRVIRALNFHKFYLTDTSLDFVSNLNGVFPNRINKSIDISNAEYNDLDESLALIRKSFKSHFGRFNNDSKINLNYANIYENWIKSSFDGYADLILIAKIKQKIVGLTVWKYKSEIENKFNINLGHYSIGAIHPEFSGKKIFHDLTTEGMILMKNKSHDFIEGPTNVANFPVQSSYARMNWRILSAKHCFHYWIS
jgi:hypothetical protein